MNVIQRASLILSSLMLFTFAAQGQDAKVPAAEPETSQSRVTDPGGIREGLGVPRLIKFSGAFRTPTGAALTGVHGVTLAVYKDRQGGAPLWLESQNVELDELGRYTVLLGATKSDGVPLDLFATNEPRWLGIQMQLPGWEEGERALLVSVPYAMKAAEAETLGGLPLSSFVLTPEAARKAGLGPGNSGRDGGSTRLSAATALPVAAVSGTGNTNRVTKWLDTGGTLGDSTITDTGSAVGVGVTSPIAPLHVKVSGTTDPILRLEGANPTDSLSMKVTHPGAVVGFALAGGAGAFFPTSGADDAILVGQATKNLLLGLGGSEAMRITSSGNVGVVNKLGVGFNTPTAPMHVLSIGTTDPALYVQGVSQTDGLSFKLAHPNAVIGFALSGGGGQFFATSAQDDAMLFGQGTKNLLLGLGGSEFMRVAASGNVGIGTTTPAQKLDVAGNINSSGAVTATSFTGDGSALTSLNATNVGSGTLANARTTATSANTANAIVARDASGNFSAGTITGSGSGLTSLNGSNISTGTVANARTTATAVNTVSTIVARDGAGRFSSGAITVADTLNSPMAPASGLYSTVTGTATSLHAIRGDAPAGKIAVIGFAGSAFGSDFSGDAGVVGVGFSATNVSPSNGVIGLSQGSGVGVFGSSISGNGIEGTSTSGLAGKFTGNVEVTGTLSVGVPTANSSVALVGQTAAIGSTTIFTTPASIGQYRVSVYGFTSTAGSAVNLAVTIGWTDPASQTQSKSTVTIPIQTLGAFDQMVLTLVAKASTNITYSTSLSGGTGGGAYDVYIKLEKL